MFISLIKISTIIFLFRLRLFIVNNINTCLDVTLLLLLIVPLRTEAVLNSKEDKQRRQHCSQAPKVLPKSVPSLVAQTDISSSFVLGCNQLRADFLQVPS